MCTRCANEACVGVCGYGKKGYRWRKTKVSVLKGMSSHDFNGDDIIKISEVSLFENMWLKTQTIHIVRKRANFGKAGDDVGIVVWYFWYLLDFPKIFVLFFVFVFVNFLQICRIKCWSAINTPYFTAHRYVIVDD